MHSTCKRRTQRLIARLYRYIAAEKNSKRHDFDVDMCFNFTIQLFSCVLVKFVQNILESRILTRKFTAA